MTVWLGDLFDGKEPGSVWWPWPTLVEQFGPMQPGDLVTVMASTGSGKTTFITSAIMGWIAADLDLALISTEMSRDQLREKMAAAEAGIPEKWLAIRDMSETTTEQYEIYRDTSRQLADIPILGLEDFGPKTLSTLQDTIQGVLALAEDPTRRIKLLVLDHLHEIGPEGSQGQLDAWSDTVLMLRDMAQSEGIVVVMVVQPKRPDRNVIPAMYRIPDIHDARGVPQVETCSHQMFGLRRCLVSMDDKERRRVVSDITANRTTIHEFAMKPPQTEVRCLKRRIWGECVHRKATLVLENGKLIDRQRVPF